MNAPSFLHGPAHIGTKVALGVCLLHLADITQPRSLWNTLYTIARLRVEREREREGEGEGEGEGGGEREEGGERGTGHSTIDSLDLHAPTTINHLMWIHTCKVPKHYIEYTLAWMYTNTVLQ